MNAGLAIVIAIVVGSTIGAITGQWWWLGITIPIGIAIGAGVHNAGKQNSNPQSVESEE
ncbi:MAG: hypothetical protein AAF664_23670 [Planctomycetota bacterium]